MRLVAVLEQHLRSDLPACSEAELPELASEARAGLAWLEGYLTRLAGEAQRREAAGAGVVAADVIRGNGELSHDRAHALAARSAVAGTLPELGQAIGAGTARPENADAAATLVAKLTPTEKQRLAAHDQDLARRAATDSPETFQRHLQARAREVRDTPAEQGPSPAEQEKARSHFGMGRKGNGRWWLNGDLADEWAEPVNDRIRARARILAGEGPVTPNHMAQALYDLITGVPDPAAAAEAGAGLLGHHTMGIGYIIDAATLFRRGGGQPGAAAPDSPTSPDPTSPDPADSPPVVAETWGGEPVDPAVIQRLACDTDLYAILIGASGEPRGTHRTHRSADRGQRLQLRALYPTCPLDGSTPFERCEIHHVNLAHGQGGPTILANLLPISSRWHHRIHDLGWHLTMRPDRTLELRTPDGTLHRTIPPPTPLTRQRE